MSDRNVSLDAVGYTQVMQLYLNRGEYRKCKIVFTKLSDQKVPLDGHVFSILVECCLKEGNLDEAVGIIELMEPNFGVKASSVIFNVGLKVLRQLRKWEDAWRLYQTMKLAKWKNAGVTPDQFTYSILMGCCNESQQFNKCVEVYEEMKREKKVQPNHPVFTQLISAYGSGLGDLDKAFSVLDEMKRNGVKPDIVTLDALVVACLRSHNSSKLVEALERLSREGVHVDARCFGAIAHYWDRNPSGEVVIALDKLSPNFRIDSKQIDLALARFAQKRMTKKAVNLMYDLHKYGIKVNFTHYSKLWKICLEDADTKGRAMLNTFRREGLFYD